MTAATNVAKALGVGGGTVRELRPGELVLESPASQLPVLADLVVQHLGGRLSTLFGTDDRLTTGQFVVHHVWSLSAPRTFLRISAPVGPGSSSFPSIAAHQPVANWFEREVMDFFGLVPEGHPNPQRVALHADWPEGAWALRKDFPSDGPVPRVAGEPVLYLQLRLFYVHKGTEKRFERLPWQHGLFLAESVSGDTSVGHALAYAHAIERLAGIEVPARASALRVVLLELERMYNHIADIGAIATDVAFTVPASRAQAQRERLLRLQERLFGTRLLRGTIALGGVKRDLSDQGRAELITHLRGLEREFDDLITMLIDSGTFTDRVDTTGILANQVARDLGVVGMAARASGIDADLRRDHPHDAYAGLRFEVPVEEGGDVRARLMIRAREVEQSFVILRQVVETMPATSLTAPLPETLPSAASALGWAEAWRGPCIHWVATDAQGDLTRVKVTDPSFFNWPGLIQAVPGNIIPDFPVINKSFNLSYSGNDR